MLILPTGIPIPQFWRYQIIEAPLPQTPIDTLS
jgi:hypothetical protein